MPLPEITADTGSIPGFIRMYLMQILKFLLPAMSRKCIMEGSQTYPLLEIVAHKAFLRVDKTPCACVGSLNRETCQFFSELNPSRTKRRECKCEGRSVDFGPFGTQKSFCAFALICRKRSPEEVGCISCVHFTFRSCKIPLKVEKWLCSPSLGDVLLL